MNKFKASMLYFLLSFCVCVVYFLFVPFNATLKHAQPLKWLIIRYILKGFSMIWYIQQAFLWRHAFSRTHSAYDPD